MVRRCTYRAPPSGIRGDHRDDLVEEEDGNSDEDDVGLITATILVILILMWYRAILLMINCADAVLVLARAAL